MKIWTFKTVKDEFIWETSVERFAAEFSHLLNKKGVEFVITVQES